MKHFLKNIIIFSVAFFILEKVFFLFIYFSPDLESDNRLEKLINGEIDKQILIFGSSRGARNIIASQMEDSLNMSAFNLSYPGSDIEFHEYLLRALLKFNPKPEMIILTMDDPEELLPSNSINFRLDRLYPLAKYKFINDELIARGEKTFLSRFIMLSRINKRNFDIRKKHFTALDTITNCGSMPISFPRYNYSFDFDDAPVKYEKGIEVENKIFAFNNFIELCKQNDMRLILVFTPNFKLPNYMFEDRIRQLKPDLVDLYIYDTTNTIYLDKSYYYDESHLQTRGAVIFTNQLIEYINSRGQLSFDVEKSGLLY